MFYNFSKTIKPLEMENLEKIMQKYVIKNLFIFVLLFLFKQIGFSQYEVEYQIIKNANKAYTEGNFNDAAELYGKVLSKGLSAPELNYNLGNAYYRLGDYKRAILNYERAKLLSPDDENISLNLELCQRYVQDKIDEVPKFFLIQWLENFKALFSANVWAYVSIFSFGIFLFSILIFLFNKSVLYRKLSLYTGFFAIIITLVSYGSASSQTRKITDNKYAIVFSPSVTVKSSPNNNGTDLFIIHEGLKVTITDKSGSWNEIRLSDGKIGWLPASSIEKI